MIKPLYFPDIYIDNAVFDALKNHLVKICLYTVTDEDSQEDGLINNRPKGVEAVCPVCDEAEKIKEFLVRGFNSTPFYNPERASQLRFEIEAGPDLKMPDKDPAALQSMRLVKAAVFLKMAEEYDRQSRAIHEELQIIQEKKQALLYFLHGEGRDNKEWPGKFENASGFKRDFQIEKRLEAWATLFCAALNETGKTGCGFYITESPALIETIMEFEPALEHVCDCCLDSDGKTSLSDFAERLITCDWDSEKGLVKNGDLPFAESGTPLISFYILPGKRPDELFKKFTKGGADDHEWEKHAKKFQNTVLGVIKI